MKLRIRASPNARKSEIIGWEEDAQWGRVLRVRVGAPAVEGKANAELREFLAKTLGLAKSKVLLQKGDGSRFKTFEVPDGTPLPCSPPNNSDPAALPQSSPSPTPP